MSGFQAGETVDITIKGVRVLTQHSDGTVVVKCDDDTGGWRMPPQAAIERAGTPQGTPGNAEQSDRIAAVLDVLDGMEREGYIQPYVAASVRKAAGLPPRHWPPQPGDVWHDGFPFGSPLWFAQVVHETGHSDLVMVPTERSPDNAGVNTPEEFLKHACEVTLAYRRKDVQ